MVLIFMPVFTKSWKFLICENPKPKLGQRVRTIRNDEARAATLSILSLAHRIGQDYMDPEELEDEELEEIRSEAPDICTFTLA